MPRLQINPEEFKRAKLVKPGWYPTLIKDVTEELAKDKQSMNIVLDLECADKESEFLGVPAKHWITEKFVVGAIPLVKAMVPGISENEVASVEFNDFKGKYVYAKWTQNRGKDGTDPARNSIEDWAPLPGKYAYLNEASAVGAAASVGGFE